MKTVLRIIMILLVGALVAGAFFLIVNYGSITSGSTNRQLSALTNNGQFTNQQMDRFERGDRSGGSITRGIAGVFGTLLELAGITILVLLIPRRFSQLGVRKLMSIQR